ncbi:MAG: YeiH family protein [Bacillota bacterium]|nr:YeiH family protein [Bacillota bacterium]
MNSKIKGILFCFVLAIPSFFLGRRFPIIGGPVFGILLGMIVAYWRRPEALNEGIKYTSKKILQYSIILLGFGMNLFDVFRVGAHSLIVMVFTLAAAFLTAYFVGKALKLHGNVPILIGVGTAICGGSAIAATAPVIKASDKEMAFSISTIFLFNVAAVFIFPALGHLMGMDDTNFGMWAGTAINDTSSVVAAGYAYSDAAGDYATIVKLTRTLMIVPITLALAFWVTKKAKTEGAAGKGDYSVKKIFPWFVLGFLGASIVVTVVSGVTESTGMASAFEFLTQIGKYCIIMAMTAIGLNTKINELVKNGVRPIVLGLCCWFAVAVVSLICQYFLM